MYFIGNLYNQINKKITKYFWNLRKKKLHLNQLANSMLHNFSILADSNCKYVTAKIVVMKHFIV